MLTLRPATLADIPMLQLWDSLPHVAQSDPNDDWDWENDLAQPVDHQQMYIAQWNGVDFGFLQLLDPSRDSNRYWGEAPPHVRAIDIWIGPAEYLNRGLGTQLMQRGIKLCFADPAVTEIWIDPIASNTDAIRFYQRLGFQFVARRWFGPDDCAVHHLTRQRWETMPAA